MGDKGEKGMMGQTGEPGTTFNSDGSTYVNWGASTCGNSGQLVYSGFAVSPRCNNAGGGAQYLCVDFSNLEVPGATTGTPMSTLTGVHFETRGTTVEFPLASPTHAEPLLAFDGRRVSCAVCLVTNGDTMMIPNNQQCPSNLQLEYTGYLMAARDYVNEQALSLTHAPFFQQNTVPGGTPPSHFRTEYVCVNQNPVQGQLDGNPTNEGKLTHTRVFCRDLIGLSLIACPNDLNCIPSVNNPIPNNHCAIGPIGCAVCTTPQPA